MNCAKSIKIILPATIFIAFLILMIEAKKYNNENRNVYQEWQEFEEFLEWKRMKENGNKMSIDFNDNYNSDSIKNYGKEDRRSQDPPPVEDAVLMARFIVNQADWTSVATISTRKDIETFPTVNLISFSDGRLGNGSGIPYLYLTPLDFTAKDLAKDNRATLFMTLAQGNYCRRKIWDPMDPRCARVILTGKIKTIKNDSPELDVAKSAVFGRHPALENMPADHHFYFAKLKMISIAVLDTFGGPKYVNVRDYLHPPTPNITEEFYKRVRTQQQDYASDSQEAYNMKPMTNFLNPTVQNI
ncbi:protein CREG1 [Polistes fuscatus]|uniref:protein CREG1 n=1 Tax=Polistes fuscatus TaxID=30207 RepID=UPI001CA90D2B|nr:protein CREG1 [Polistes fuscatus]